MDTPASTPDPLATPLEADTPREVRLDSVASQTAAIDTLVGFARARISVFDIDLSEGGWSTEKRTGALAAFLRIPNARLEIIVHDTRWIETSAPRLASLLRTYGHAMTVYRTGEGARTAMNPLLIVDQRHFLHRYHIDQPRATLAIAMPQATSPLATRFDEIWATGEPGLTGTVLGL